MAVTLCTLFNSIYLDKGLVLYDSLVKCAKDFNLYVLCMDEKCYEVLSTENYPYLIPIKLEDFENEELLRVKKKRKLGEYFWTCSSWLISYVLDTYKPDHCAYIDADMYFYLDPSVLIEEMVQRNATVLIVGHRFLPLLAKEKAWKVGKYCVEFNAFKNEERALALLNKWKYQVLERCSLDGDGIHWGDQKYLDQWSELDFVVETGNMGAGVAPWNISQYKLKTQERDTISIINGGKISKLVFYHFENIQYLDEHTVNANLELYWGCDKSLINKLYIPYLRVIASQKSDLRERYGIENIIKQHPGVTGALSNDGLLLRIMTYMRMLCGISKRSHDLLYPIKYLLQCKLPQMLFGKYSIINY